MSRDRDDAGRPRNSRPRDRLGRPLARDDDTDEAAEPEPAALPPADALAEAQRLLDDGRAFRAHEVLEAVWKSTSDGRDMWRGLAQLAVGLTHRDRGNHTGAAALLRRGAETLAPFRAAPPYGVAVGDLMTWAEAAAGDPAQAPPMPRLVGQAADERS